MSFIVDPQTNTICQKRDIQIPLLLLTQVSLPQLNQHTFVFVSLLNSTVPGEAQHKILEVTSQIGTEGCSCVTQSIEHTTFHQKVIGSTPALAIRPRLVGSLDRCQFDLAS